MNSISGLPRASDSRTARDLLASSSRNASVVATGAARREWVVVTREQTTGGGSYAGLPATLHVTLGRVRRVGGGWVVSEWSPGS